jgi:hypothetical protein
VDTTLGLVSPFGYGKAYPDTIDVTTPAAGATASYTVPGDYYVRVVAARLSITTDANAANRLITLDYISGRGVTYMQNGAGLVVTASTTAQVFQWDAHRTVAEWAANTPVFAPLLSAFLPPSWVIKFNVANIQATDAISALRLWVENFPTGQKGYPVGPVTLRHGE